MPEMDMAMGDGGGPGPHPFGSATSASASAYGTSNLDSGVLPVKIPPLFIGDQYCFERVLVHGKTHLSLRMNYINREWRNHTISGLLAQIGYAPILYVVVLLAVCLALALMWRRSMKKTV